MKPGTKSTEFWLTLAVILAAVANGTTVVNIPWEQFQWIVGLTGVYAGSRSFVKGMQK